MDSPLGAVLGGACYGGWALFVNLVAGFTAALRIGLTHWAMSAGLTLCGVGLMNRLFRLARQPVHGAALSFIGSMTATYLLLIGVHGWLGTPHLLLTLAPGVLPTSGFCLLYSLLLLRHARAGETAPTAHGAAA